VRTLKNAYLAFNVDLMDLIEYVMEFIHEKEGVPVMRQDIICNEKELEWR
jgi:hypothetical protein